MKEIQEVYKRWRHLDRLLSDPEWLPPGDAARVLGGDQSRSRNAGGKA